MTAKKTITGVISGKFSPFHKGHELFVRKALNHCDKLYVMVYDYNIQGRLQLPVDSRVGLINSIINDNRVEIIACHNPPPKSFSKQMEQAHKEYAIHKLGGVKIDKVFCNSTDGEYIAKALDATLVQLDPKRQSIPTSSTMITDLYKQTKELLPEEYYKAYTAEYLKDRQIQKEQQGSFTTKLSTELASTCR